MEILTILWGALLSGVGMLLTGLLILWILFMVIGTALLRKRKPKKVRPAAPAPTMNPTPTPHHPASGGGGHGHDGHHGGGHGKTPLWQTLLGWCFLVAAIVATLKFLVIPFFADKGFGQIPGQTGGRVYVARGATPSARVIPSDAVFCPETGAITIQPGRSIRVVIRTDSFIDFQPNTEDGTITACDYHRPGVCSSTTSLLDVGTSVLTIKNITLGTANQRPVRFTCHYVPR